MKLDTLTKLDNSKIQNKVLIDIKELINRVIAMNGMIDDILRLDDQDFKSLVETRILLELKTYYFI